VWSARLLCSAQTRVAPWVQQGYKANLGWSGGGTRLVSQRRQGRRRQLSEQRRDGEKERAVQCGLCIPVAVRRLLHIVQYGPRYIMSHSRSYSTTHPPLRLASTSTSDTYKGLSSEPSTLQCRYLSLSHHCAARIHLTTLSHLLPSIPLHSRTRLSSERTSTYTQHQHRLYRTTTTHPNEHHLLEPPDRVF
jgi:hypothetical protein